MAAALKLANTMSLAQSAKSLFSRFKFKPKDSSQITLFANKAEAIVFWLCVSGLAFLGIIVLFRYLTARAISGDHKNLQAGQVELRLAVDSLRAHNQLLEHQMADLQLQLRRAMVRADSIVDELKRRPNPSQANRSPASENSVARDSRSATLKNLFRIERRTQVRTAAK